MIFNEQQFKIAEKSTFKLYDF